MILYPTETLYAIGVNALDRSELAKLYELKGRDAGKVASWLVRSIDDIRLYAKVPPKAVKIATRFLPGPLTLVLRVHDTIAVDVVAPDRTIGFRMSRDLQAATLVKSFMEKYTVPLTCTSANVSGAPTLSTPTEILQQFGERAAMIDEIVDDGPRKGLASTVVRVIDDEMTVIREGEISAEDIARVADESV